MENNELPPFCGWCGAETHEGHYVETWWACEDCYESKGIDGLYADLENQTKSIQQEEADYANSSQSYDSPLSDVGPDYWQNDAGEWSCG